MASPQPRSDSGEPVAENQATTLPPDSVDAQEASGLPDDSATVPVAADPTNTGNAPESSQPKSEAPSPGLSTIPKEIQTSTSDMNHITETTEPAAAVNENDMAEAPDTTNPPTPNNNNQAEASGDTVPQADLPELTKSRTIKIKKRLLTTPKERDDLAAVHGHRLQQAQELYQQSLIPNWPAQVNPQVDQPRIQPTSPIQDNDIQILEPGNRDSPISVDSEAQNEAATIAFKKAKRAFERKEKRDPNSITLGDRIKFCQHQDAEKKRLSYLKRKRAGAEREDAERGAQVGNNELEDGDDGSDLFVSSAKANTVYLTGENPAKRSKPSRANRVPDKAYQSSMLLGYGAAMASQAQSASKKPRKPKGSTAQKDPKTRASKAKDKGPKKDDGTEKTPKKKRGPAKRSGPRLANIGSLLNNDIIADAQAIQGREGQAKFTSKNRKDALAELIASMPTEQRKPHTADKKALEDACKKFTWKGQGSMQAKEGKWLLKGMRNGLMPHQLLGAAWMRDRENSASPPYGGLVADSMGFGKTIQMLSNVLDGRPSPASPNQTTLVVCPSSLCSQWLNEVRKHIEPGLLGEVIVYRSGNRTMTEDPLKTLSKAGMVITSYSEVLRSYPHTKPPAELVTPELKRAWWEQHYKNERGDLHRIFFRRIILDEAQQIKNPKSKISISCRGLIGKYKWMLTGTPILNAIEELWPYFDFLQVPHAGSFETFKENFCKRSDQTRKRLDHMLNLIMLRRTLSDEMFGRPILKLPPIARQTVFVDFNPTERAIYNIVRTRFIKKISVWYQGGEIQRKFKGVWVMFLRLRQLCAHALLIQDTIKDLLEAEDVEKLWRLTRQEVNPSQTEAEVNTIIALRKLLKKQSTNQSQQDRRGDTLDEPIEVAAEEAPDEQQSTGGQFGSSYKFRKYLRNLKNTGKWDEIQNRSLCHKCHQIPENPHVTVPCEHIYCKECLSSMLFDLRHSEAEKARCLECDTIFERSEPCEGYDAASHNPNELGLRRPSQRGSRSSDPENKEDDWLNMSGQILPSAKSLAIKAQLLNWFGESPNCKCIIFSQFIGMLKVLGRVASDEGWDCKYFVGSMTMDQRDKAISEFREDPNIKLMLASLKCGGLGLNLTMANRVIIVDPWWNQGVEDQAWSRVYRIGQESDVEIRRICVRDTIDTELLLRMQERKTEEINRTIDDNALPEKLSVDELIKLFGSGTLTEDGLPMVDDDGDAPFIFVKDAVVHDDSDAELPDTAPPPPFE